LLRFLFKLPPRFRKLILV